MFILRFKLNQVIVEAFEYNTEHLSSMCIFFLSFHRLLLFGQSLIMISNLFSLWVSFSLQISEARYLRLRLFLFIFRNNLVGNLRLHLVDLLLVHFVDNRLKVLLVYALVEWWYRRHDLHLRFVMCVWLTFLTLEYSRFLYSSIRLGSAALGFFVNSLINDPRTTWFQEFVEDKSANLIRISVLCSPNFFS